LVHCHFSWAVMSGSSTGFCSILSW